jgi:F0F1-type ATP synthase delta subunit
MLKRDEKAVGVASGTTSETPPYLIRIIATFHHHPVGRLRNFNRSPSDAPSDRKRTITAFLEEHGQAKAADFVKVIGLSDGRVRALLREMAGDGTIEKVGDNRYAYYVLKR